MTNKFDKGYTQGRDAGEEHAIDQLKLSIEWYCAAAYPFKDCPNDIEDRFIGIANEVMFESLPPDVLDYMESEGYL